MLRVREQTTAEHFGIVSKIERFKDDLLTINGVEDVEFDLDGFWSDIHQVIFLPKYNIPFDQYFEVRSDMIHDIIDCANRHGLTRTVDQIEDYGSHLYIVTDCPWVRRNGKIV